MDRRKTIIFDIDSTLADASSIKHVLPDFDAYHALSEGLPVIGWVVEHAREAKRNGFTVIQVTARQEKYRNVTQSWLDKNDIPSDGLFMRTDGDVREDCDIKRDLFAKISSNYDVVKAFEDREDVAALWKEHGIPCVMVYDGGYLDQ